MRPFTPYLFALYQIEYENCRGRVCGFYIEYIDVVVGASRAYMDRLGMGKNVHCI